MIFLLSWGRGALLSLFCQGMRECHMFDFYSPHVYPVVVVRSVYHKTHTLIIKGSDKLSVIAHASNVSTLEAKVGRSL